MNTRPVMSKHIDPISIAIGIAIDFDGRLFRGDEALIENHLDCDCDSDSDSDGQRSRWDAQRKPLGRSVWGGIA